MGQPLQAQLALARYVSQPKPRKPKLTEEEKQARAKQRKQERERLKRRRLISVYQRVCSGCRDNRYNYRSGGDGWNSPTSGDGCWSLTSIKRGVCPAKRSY